MFVTFSNGKTKAWAKKSHSHAMDDAADLRLSIAGEESKQSTYAKKRGGTWAIAPYWPRCHGCRREPLHRPLDGRGSA